MKLYDFDVRPVDCVIGTNYPCTAAFAPFTCAVLLYREFARPPATTTPFLPFLILVIRGHQCWKLSVMSE